MGAIQNKVEGPVSEELALVQAAKQGDDSAFEELVRRYDRNVFRIAQHITQNREDAEDVVQEAFLKAYGNLAKFQEQSKFYTWLVRIAVNEALMKLRRRKPERTVSLDEDIKTEDDSLPREIADWSPNPEQQYTQAELREILSKTIQGLPPGFPNSICSAGRGRFVHGRDRGGAGVECAGGKVAVVAGPPAIARRWAAIFRDGKWQWQNDRKAEMLNEWQWRWQPVKCSEFLNELTSYLDGVLDEKTKVELENHLVLVPQLLRCLRHYQENHRDLSRLATLRIARRPPQPPALSHHDKVPAAQEARPAERLSFFKARQC